MEARFPEDFDEISVMEALYRSPWSEKPTQNDEKKIEKNE